MNEEQRKLMLDMIKDAKMTKGAILSNEAVDEIAEKAKELSDEDLLLNMTRQFGEFVLYVIMASPDKGMAAYGLAVGYYILEREAQDRGLYW